MKKITIFILKGYSNKSGNVKSFQLIYNLFLTVFIRVSETDPDQYFGRFGFEYVL